VAHRIASLLPSCTEIACALGFEDALVGRSHECDYPPSVAKLPPLTEPKLDVDAPSAEIDARVRQLVEGGLSVYRVDAEKLRELEPTVILTQDQCEVCAASPKDLEDALAEWTGAQPKVVSLSPNTLADVWADIQRVADALGVPDRGRELTAKLAERVKDVAQRTIRIRRQPTVVCLEWLDPLMTAGHWMPELVTLAGGQNLLGESGAHSPYIEWRQLRDADPDAVVVLPCGFDLERTKAETAKLAGRPEWQALRAVRKGKVYLTDGHQYFNRPGPRLVDSLEILAEVLHPDQFPPRHGDTGWNPL